MKVFLRISYDGKHISWIRKNYTEDDIKVVNNVIAPIYDVPGQYLYLLKSKDNINIKYLLYKYSNKDYGLRNTRVPIKKFDLKKILKV